MTGAHDLGRAMERAQHAMVAGSADGTITFVNERFTRETGLAADDVVGRPYSILIHPEDLPHESSLFRRLVGGDLDFYDCSPRLLTSEGDHRRFDISVIAVSDGDGIGGALVMLSPRAARDRSPPPVSMRGDRMIIRDGGRTLVLPGATVSSIEADGTYSVVHAEGEQHLVRLPLRAFEEGLDDSNFCRVHRSRVVNFTHLREIQHLPRGDAEAVLKGGATVRVARSRRSELERRLRANPPLYATSP